MRLALACLALLPLASCRGPGDELRRHRTEALQKVLDQFRAESRFPGAVAGAWFSDSTSMVVASGLADRDRQLPMPASALLHAGSVGKTFFAALVLQLVAEGKIALDGKVSLYLGAEPWFAGVPNADSITVRMLLNHTSGIPEWGGGFMTALVEAPGQRRPPLDGVKSVVDAKPLFPAGSKFGYTDVNYQLLQLLAEEVTGESAYTGIARRILKPLGLAGIVPADAKRLPGLVPGYAGKGFFMGFDAVMEGGELLLDPAFEGGGGGYVTNPGALAEWIALFTEGAAFDSALLPEVLTGVPAGQLDVGQDALSGLGIEIVDTPLGRAFGHGGFFPGYLALVLWFPDRGVSLAIQVNSSASDAPARPLREVLLEAARALTSP